ncbi:hypothetical protein GX441_00055 [bacterium]|nr:hypothetical protein [bacterium]
MRKVIAGRKYIFTVESSNFSFYIEALEPTTRRFSYINNLNPILSIFNVSIDDPKVSESQWKVKPLTCAFYFQKAISFLSDLDSREYIEGVLDEDRSLGEWEYTKPG